MKIIILGAGALSKLVLDTIREINKVHNKYDIIGLLDDSDEFVGKQVLGYDVIGKITDVEKYVDEETVFVCSVASTKDKKRIVSIADEAGMQSVNLIHPTAFVSDFAVMGTGNVIGAGAVVAAEVNLKNHTFINFNCTVGHDVICEDYVSVMPGVNLAGFVQLKEGAYIGMDATVLQNNVVGKYSTVGANSLVTKNVEANTTVVGTPARLFKKN